MYILFKCGRREHQYLCAQSQLQFKQHDTVLIQISMHLRGRHNKFVAATAFCAATQGKPQTNEKEKIEQYRWAICYVNLVVAPLLSSSDI